MVGEHWLQRIFVGQQPLTGEPSIWDCRYSIAPNMKLLCKPHSYQQISLCHPGTF